MYDRHLGRASAKAVPVDEIEGVPRRYSERYGGLTVKQMKVLLFANTEWYLYNFRMALAHALRDAGYEVVLVSPPGPYGARLEQQGLRWLSIEMRRRGLNPLSEILVICRLAQIYRRERPDYVHNFTIKCVVYGALAARFAGVARRIHAITGMGFVYASQKFKSRLLRLLVTGLMRVSMGGAHSRLIVQNQDDLAAVERLGLVRRDRARLIRGSGVNTNSFRPRSDGTRGQRPFRILMATRLIREKGVGEYVEAARMLKCEGDAIECLLAGDADEGNPSGIPASEIAEWHEEGAVTVLGHVDDMAELLSEVDVVVLPSRYREGVPRILIEAAASGLPIVTTDMPGCREIVTDGENGILVPPSDVTKLAAAIRKLANDPELCRKMGRAGRERVVNEYDERIVLDRTLAVFRELA